MCAHGHVCTGACTDGVGRTHRVGAAVICGGWGLSHLPSLPHTQLYTSHSAERTPSPSRVPSRLAEVVGAAHTPSWDPHPSPSPGRPSSAPPPRAPPGPEVTLLGCPRSSQGLWPGDSAWLQSGTGSCPFAQEASSLLPRPRPGAPSRFPCASGSPQEAKETAKPRCRRGPPQAPAPLPQPLCSQQQTPASVPSLHSLKTGAHALHPFHAPSARAQPLHSPVTLAPLRPSPGHFTSTVNPPHPPQPPPPSANAAAPLTDTPAERVRGGGQLRAPQRPPNAPRAQAPLAAAPSAAGLTLTRSKVAQPARG